ncbi:unnamed protein product [Caenorhabditis angaria]|uniref:Uncharacterized protein n=1 Tax=Caenorhabditis angaria TaxID=860376 RepID=A0A9P1IXV0_9PELO|nr:unnamed protein product [Caenorhabditis angaria]
MLYIFLVLILIQTVSGAGDIEVESSVANRSIAIKGQLFCGKKPFEGAKIRLYRVFQANKEDNLAEILDSKQTYVTGMFQLEGNTEKRDRTKTEIQPFVTIHHNCDMDNKETANQGYKRWQVQIPQDYVTLGVKARKTYDFGKINLQLEFPGESYDKNFKFND